MKTYARFATAQELHMARMDMLMSHYPCDCFENEDALDQETVPFDEALDAGISYACYTQYGQFADDWYERHDYVIGHDEIAPLMLTEEQQLEVAREGYLVSVYLDRKVQ
jgi:hypothetical protein